MGKLYADCSKSDQMILPRKAAVRMLREPARERNEKIRF